jgi:hypothetical protein
MRNSSDEKKLRKIFANLCNAILAVAFKVILSLKYGLWQECFL